jgi:hypothetical protein
VTKISGTGLEIERSGRGVAFGDLDNDGDLDLVINNQNDPPTVLRNEGGNRNHCLQVRVQGTESNRDGIGARISVSGNGRKQIDEVRSGGSYLSQSDLCLHFGTGQVEHVDEVEVCWPSGKVDILKDLAVDQRLLIQEGKGLVRATSIARRESRK